MYACIRHYTTLYTISYFISSKQFLLHISDTEVIVHQFLSGVAEEPVLCNHRTLWNSHRSARHGSIFARCGSGELRLNLLMMPCDMCWPLCVLRPFRLLISFSMGLSRRTQTHVRSPLAVTVNETSSDPDADPHCAFSAFNFGLRCTNCGWCGQRTWARALSRVSSITHTHTDGHTLTHTHSHHPSAFVLDFPSD